MGKGLINNLKITPSMEMDLHLHLHMKLHLQVPCCPVEPWHNLGFLGVTTTEQDKEAKLCLLLEGQATA